MKLTQVEQLIMKMKLVFICRLEISSKFIWSIVITMSGKICFPKAS